ncbi:MAG TPA: hypothetical protein VN577_15855 [Terriglobales bacterium]|nr:hypothetical protein [Terriglobales bacterium]
MPRTSTDHTRERRKAMSEAFHSFHQPLTGLHCGLELALIKANSHDEYRERVEDALARAGTVMELTQAIRELAESTDPGERFGTVDLAPLLAQLVDELSSFAAEQADVRVLLTEMGPAYISADPAKLMRSLGNLIVPLIARLHRGSAIEIRAMKQESDAVIVVEWKGSGRAQDGADTDSKAREIRCDAARSYIWTLGGEIAKGESRLEVRLPLA